MNAAEREYRQIEARIAAARAELAQAELAEAEFMVRQHEAAIAWCERNGLDPANVTYAKAHEAQTGLALGNANTGGLQ
jgi:hypothetical protein